MNQPGHRAPATLLRWSGIPTHPLETDMSTEYEIHIEDMTGDWVTYRRPTLPAALATVRQARDELSARAQIWQREPGGDWVFVGPKRRWFLPWTWNAYHF